MINEKTYRLGANRSAIRDLFEYGRQRAALHFSVPPGSEHLPPPREAGERRFEPWGQPSEKTDISESEGRSACFFQLLDSINRPVTKHRPRPRGEGCCQEPPGKGQQRSL